jgi:diadenosine tetraphosphate (Ap4A) HIT family hydrolase
LELLYPFDTECCVELIDGKVKIHGDFTEENKKCPSIPLPPFSTFAPGHFGMSSGLDIEVPENYVLRLEPHPRFYVDTTNTVPCCITGHLQTNWWPKIFFVVFKNPIPGQTLIFRKGEPYGQILILPKKVSYEIQEMSPEEKAKRNQVDAKIEKYYKKFVKNDWIDNEGHNFNDTYKQLSSLKGNLSDVERFLDQFAEENKKKKIKCKLVKKKNHETI